MPKRVEITLVILWKNERWEEWTTTMHMPGGSTHEEAVDTAIKATISNLASIGKLDEVKAMGNITGFVEIDVKEKEEPPLSCADWKAKDHGIPVAAISPQKEKKE